MGIRRLCWGILHNGAGALAMSTPTNTLISDLPTGGVLACGPWVTCGPCARMNLASLRSFDRDSLD